MSKKEKEKSRSIPVSFQGVTVNEDKCSIPVHALRTYLNLDVADLGICKARLDVTLCEHDPDQGNLQEEADEEVRLVSVADANTLTVSPEKINFTLSFQRSDIDVNKLIKFAKRSGYLRFQRIGDAKSNPDDQSRVGNEPLLDGEEQEKETAKA